MIRPLAAKLLAPALLAGAAAAIAAAPLAGATESADCLDTGSSTVCTRTGHAAIYSEPPNNTHTLNFGPSGLPLYAVE